MTKVILFFLLAGASVGLQAQASSARIQDPRSMECRIDYPGVTQVFRIWVNGNFVLELDRKVTGSWADPLLNQCLLAKFQAIQDGTPVYVDVVTGEVVPENGFFVRSK